MDDALRYLHEQLRVARTRYTYFLLAASASAIALVVNQTQGQAISLSQTPLGLAVLAWGLSFFCGARNVQYENSNLYANYDLLRVLAGSHPEIVGKHPDFAEAAASGISDAMKDNADVAGKFGDWQFRLLIIGALLYLAWHVFEMVLRSRAAT